MWIESGGEVLVKWLDRLERLERASTMLSKALRSLTEGDEGGLEGREAEAVGGGRAREEEEELVVLVLESNADCRLSVIVHRERNSWTSMKIPAPASGVAARPRSETTTML